MKRSNVGVSGLSDLAKQVEDLSPPDKLRFAAGLLENRKAELAYVIARKVIDELGAALALAKHGPPVDSQKPNPFDGLKIQPWRAPNSLWASGRGGDLLVGAVRHDGWIAWGPSGVNWIAEGPETGDEGRGLVEDALIDAGATIPWRAKP